jgi:hypothetical protein
MQNFCTAFDHASDSFTRTFSYATYKVASGLRSACSGFTYCTYIVATVPGISSSRTASSKVLSGVINPRSYICTTLHYTAEH